MSTHKSVSVLLPGYIRLRPIVSLIGGLLLLLSVNALSADSPRSPSSSPLRSTWSPADDGDVGGVVGSFVVSVPRRDVWSGEAVRRVRRELGALSVRDWAADYVIQGEGRLRAERLIWGLAESAADEGLSAATDALRRHGFVETVNVDFDSGLGDRFANVGVDALGSLYESEDSALAWQLRGYAGRSERGGGNAGIIYRWAAKNGWLVGVNTFLDYQKEEEDGFLRWSVGVETRSAWTDVFANYYEGISDDVISERDGAAEAAWTASGYDIEVNVHAPTQRWLTGVVGYYSWRGKYGRADVEGFRFGFKIVPHGLPLTGEVSYASEDDGEHLGGRIFYRHRFGDSPGGVPLSAKFRPRDWLYESVDREYTQRVYRHAVTGSALNLRGFRRFEITPQGSAEFAGVDTAGETVTIAVDRDSPDPVRNEVGALFAGAVTLETSGGAVVSLFYETSDVTGVLAVGSTVVLDGLSVRLNNGSLSLSVAGRFTVSPPASAGITVVTGESDNRPVNLGVSYNAGGAGNITVVAGVVDVVAVVADDTLDLNLACEDGVTSGSIVEIAGIAIEGGCLPNLNRANDRATPLVLNIASGLNTFTGGGGGAGTSANPWVVPRANLNARSNGGIVLATASGGGGGETSPAGYAYSGDNAAVFAVDADDGEIAFAQDVSAQQSATRYTVAVTVAAVNNIFIVRRDVVFFVPAAFNIAPAIIDGNIVTGGDGSVGAPYIVSTDDVAVGNNIIGLAVTPTPSQPPVYTRESGGSPELAVDSRGNIRFVSAPTPGTRYSIGILYTSGGFTAGTVSVHIQASTRTGVRFVPSSPNNLLFSEDENTAGTTAANPWHYIRGTTDTGDLGQLSVLDENNNVVPNCTFDINAPFRSGSAAGGVAVAAGGLSTAGAATIYRFAATCTGVPDVTALNFYYRVIEGLSADVVLASALVPRSNLSAGVVVAEVNGTGGVGGDAGNRYTYSGANTNLTIDGDGNISFARDVSGVFAAAAYELVVTVDDNSGAPAGTVTVTVSVAAGLQVSPISRGAGTGRGTADDPFTYFAPLTAQQALAEIGIGAGVSPFTYNKVGSGGDLVITGAVVHFNGIGTPGRHFITVRVQDSSSPPLDGFATLAIRIRTLLEVSLDNRIVELAIGEGSPGQVVARATAGGGSGNYRYGLLLRGGGVFPSNIGIDENTGEIALNAPFPGEGAHVLELLATAREAAGPADDITTVPLRIIVSGPRPVPAGPLALSVNSVLPTNGDSTAVAGTNDNPWVLPANSLSGGVVLAVASASLGSGAGYGYGGTNADLAVNAESGVISLVRNIAALPNTDDKYTLALTATDGAGAGVSQDVVFLVPAAVRSERISTRRVNGGSGALSDPYIVYREDIAADARLVRVAVPSPSDSAIDYARRAADSSAELALTEVTVVRADETVITTPGDIHFTSATPATGLYSIAVDYNHPDSPSTTPDGAITVYINVRNAPSIRSVARPSAFGGRVSGTGVQSDPYVLYRADLVSDAYTGEAREFAVTRSSSSTRFLSSPAGDAPLFYRAGAESRIGFLSRDNNDFQTALSQRGDRTFSVVLFSSPAGRAVLTVYVSVLDRQLELRFSDLPGPGNADRVPLLRGDFTGDNNPPGTRANPYRLLGEVNGATSDIGVLSVVEAETGGGRGGHVFSVAPADAGIFVDEGSGVVFEGNLSLGAYSVVFSAAGAVPNVDPVEPLEFHLRVVDDLHFSVVVLNVFDEDGRQITDSPLPVVTDGVTVGTYEVPRETPDGDSNLTSGAVVAVVEGGGGDERFITGVDVDGNPTSLFGNSYTYRGESEDGLAVDETGGEIRFTRDVSAETAPAGYRITVTIDDDSGVPAHTEVVVISVPGIPSDTMLDLQTTCPSLPETAGREAGEPCLTQRSRANTGARLLDVGVSAGGSAAVQSVTGSNGADAADDVELAGTFLRLASNARSGDEERTYTVVLALTDSGGNFVRLSSVYIRLLSASTALTATYRVARGVVRATGSRFGAEAPYIFRVHANANINQFTGGLLTVMVPGAVGARTYSTPTADFAVDGDGVVTFTGTLPTGRTLYTVTVTVTVSAGGTTNTYETTIVIEARTRGVYFTPNSQRTQLTEGADGSIDNPYTFSSNDSAGARLGTFSGYGGGSVGGLCGNPICSRDAGLHFILSQRVGGSSTKDLHVRANSDSSFLPHKDNAWEASIRDGSHGEYSPVYIQFEYTPIRVASVRFFHTSSPSNKSVGPDRFLVAPVMVEGNTGELHIRIPRASLILFPSEVQNVLAIRKRQIFQLRYLGGTNRGFDNVSILSRNDGRFFSVAATPGRMSVAPALGAPPLGDPNETVSYEFTMRVDDGDGAGALVGPGRTIPRSARNTDPLFINVLLEITVP